jgi:hypothetical protein
VSNALASDNIMLEKLSKLIPQIVVYGGIIVILFDDALHSTFNIPTFVPINIRISILAAVIASLTWIISSYSKKIDKSIAEFSRWKNSDAEIIDNWGEINIARKYRSAKNIKILNLAGTQFAQLGKQSSLDSIFDLTKTQNVQILIGDPVGEGVRLRYKNGWGEPQTYETGIDGIERRLKDLYARWKELSNKNRRKIEIKVFPIYPTVSFVKIDHDYYSATYGFELRGGDCPKVHTVSGCKYSYFLDKHFNNVFASAMKLEDWIKQYHEELL